VGSIYWIIIIFFLYMSFTDNKDSDNYSTDANGWELIKQFIPTDKILYAPFITMESKKEIFKLMGFDIIHEDEDFF